LSSLAVVPTVPGDLRLSRLSDDEQRTVRGLIQQLQHYQRHNQLMDRYYEGKQRVRDLGIAIPPHLRNIETVVGWPGTGVDALEERLDHDGWTVPGDPDGALGVDEIVDNNHLDDELRAGRLDALIYGISFITAGTGEAGEPNPLVTVESPKWMTASWNRRRRAVDAAISVSWGDAYPGQVTALTLYLLVDGRGKTLQLEANGVGQWRVRDRDDHRLPFVPVWPMANRTRRSDDRGRSEITRAMRTVTDNAVRTVLGMEVAREFFSAPQRWIMGASESSFVDKDGKPKTAWETYLGRVLALERPEGSEKNPEVGQFAASSPSPFLEQLRGLAQMAAAESAVPVKYFGLVHESNPASADAALIDESRLNKRAERRQSTFGRAEAAAMRGAVWLRDGEDPGVTPRPKWKPAATPTMAAAADRAYKLTKIGILPPDSEVTLEQVGLDEDQRERVLDDLRRSRSRQTVEALAAAAQAAGNGADDGQ
jgi:hypothetical protein